MFHSCDTRGAGLDAVGMERQEICSAHAPPLTRVKDPAVAPGQGEPTGPDAGAPPPTPRRSMHADERHPSRAPRASLAHGRGGDHPLQPALRHVRQADARQRRGGRGYGRGGVRPPAARLWRTRRPGPQRRGRTAHASPVRGFRAPRALEHARRGLAGVPDQRPAADPGARRRPGRGRGGPGLPVRGFRRARDLPPPARRGRAGRRVPRLRRPGLRRKERRQTRASRPGPRWLS